MGAKTEGASKNARVDLLQVRGMFGIGVGEMLVIAVILLIAVGPRQLPSLMKTVGRSLRELQKASGELRRSVGIEQLLADEDLRDPLREPPARHKLTPLDLEREAPSEGVDVSALRHKLTEAARVASETGPGPSDAGDRPRDR